MYEYITDFQNMALGVFVHFGLYSVVGKGEWYSFGMTDEQRKEYEKAASKFFVKKDWARKLVAVVKKAGAKYITLTTRHHEGFSLFDACGLSDFDAPHSACGRDLVAEFVDECNKAGIVPFFYHTLVDWHEPTYQADFAAYIDYLVKSVELLCTRYGKIGGFWFDGYWDKPDADWQFDRLYGTIRKYQPTAMIINNTGLNALGQVLHNEIDSVTFERGKPFFVDNSDRPRAGEMCEGLTDHWGYAKRDICVKSPKQVVETFVDCRKYNCNLLLNSGPKGDGSLTEIEKSTLLYLGEWIRANKSFVYGSERAEFDADNAVVFRKGNDYYVAIDNVPMSANANVARAQSTKQAVLHTSRKIKSAVWLDNGKRANFADNVLDVEPFEYGTALGTRVAKITFQQPKIEFLGDSITEGAGAELPENMYTTVLCKMLGAKELNYGVGGTRIAAQTKPSQEPSMDQYFLQRAKKMDKKADFLFVFGGTNDFGHGDAPFGQAGDRTDFTFCGALYNLLQYLTKVYDSSKICFILPVHRYNEDSTCGDGSKQNGKPLSAYRQAIKDFCGSFGVDCLDLCDLFPVPKTQGDEYTADGLHPNVKGHKAIAERLFKYLVDNKKI